VPELPQETKEFKLEQFIDIQIKYVILKKVRNGEICIYMQLNGTAVPRLTSYILWFNQEQGLADESTTDLGRKCTVCQNIQMIYNN
jgi:hypothetical protein